MIIELSLPTVHTCAHKCGTCGLVWAVIQGKRGSCLLNWISDCPACGLGSILGDPWDIDWETALRALPHEELQRELFVYYASLSRNPSMLTPEELSQLQLYRDRINAGEQPSIEQTREALRLLRSDRMNAAKRAQASKAASGGKAKSKAPARSAGELLGKLGIPGLGT